MTTNRPLVGQGHVDAADRPVRTRIAAIGQFGVRTMARDSFDEIVMYRGQNLATS